MKTAELKSILQSPYSRKSWISTLQFLSGKRDLVTINLSPIEIDINTKEANKIVDQFHQIGSVRTTDNITLPIFEVVLNKDIKIEHNRVAVNEFIKKHIIKDAIKGALVTFSYANVETEDDLLIFNADCSSKSEWRFSFISKNAANDFFAEVIGKETNPKKFTYIFGNNEAHRTAIERLYNLEQSRFRLDDFFEAFNVEPVSKKFFDEYKLIYKDLASYIYEIEEYKKVFTKISSDDEGTKRDIRSFVGRLMGRIVFLYFLQKKNWLGASNTEFIDGSTSFLSDLFKNDTENQNDLYTKYLCPIFFEALNTNRGKSQEFTLENGNTVCIPFLNGGLFEEEQEPSGHRNIKFRKSDFNRIFDFFNSYNFTVYENSPEEHTIAVDPEMLGHIFENLIDYNKETGTFYTPKEIVQYMTRESIIEYLFTNTDIKRENLESLVINQFADNISDRELKNIEGFLDSVKICDPAIGSGAFPVGMLQEIFNLKALINYRLKDKEWNPAYIKQNIIQNSIYGVDIDNGAVEIARLRFWLSLVIDEGLPKPLPNLDFKIVIGNSLTSKFDLNVNINSVFNDFNNKISNHEIDDSEILDIIDGDTIDVDFYKKIVNKYLVESNHKKKLAFKKLINAIKESFSSTINGKENKAISVARGNITILEQINIFGNIKGSKKEISEAKKKLKNLEQNKKNIIEDAIYKDAIEWRFEFPQLLDENANFIGFDIVIGNPPYIQIKWLNNKELYEKLNYETFVKSGDIYCLFYELATKILKKKGSATYITSNKWIRSEYGKKLRDYFLENSKPLKLIDFKGYKVFETATVDTNILLWKKESYLLDTEVLSIEGDYKKSSSLHDYFNQKFQYSKFIKDNSWLILNDNEIFIKNLVEKHRSLSLYVELNYGILTGANPVFIIDQSKYEELVSMDANNKNIIKPILRGKDIFRYGYNFSNIYLINSNNGIKEKGILPVNIENDYPTLLSYFESFGDKFKKRGEKGINWYNLRSCNYIDLYKEPKIIYADIVQDRGKFFYDENQFFTNDTAFIISGPGIKSLTAFLNSKLISFLYKTFYSGGGLGDKGLRFKKEFLNKIPIPANYDKDYLNFFVEILQYIRKTENEDSNNFLTICDFFEDIIDGLIFDLYFEDEMKNNNIYITELIYETLINHNLLEYSKLEKLDSVEKSNLIYNLYKEWSLGEVQIKMSDYIVKSPNLLKIILQN